ncbi:MAG: ATP-binding protein [Thermoleophilaceae bacterium]
MVFIDRADELAALRDNWEAPDARFFVLWGRRRVGKTELLSHFVKGKHALYFEATEANELDQLRDFSQELARSSDDALLAQQPVTTWVTALTAIEQFARDERTVVVLDEFQYLVAQNRGLGSLLNRWWRETGRGLPLVLIIAGSEVAFFEREILAGATYGRRTGQSRLTPFTYESSALFTPGYSADDKVRTYAVCGGMPYYLERIDDGVPLSENILQLILYRDGFLHEEAELLIRQELDDPHNYFSILRAVANGRTRMSEIAATAGLSTSSAAQFIATLERMQLVEQRRPITAPRTSKKTTYAILDGFLNFYFRFVEPHRSMLRTRDHARQHLERTVLPELDHFVSKPAWEAICRDHMARAERAASIGAWWGQAPTGEGRRTEAREVDVVAIDENAEVLAVGSCKWTNAPMAAGEESLLTRLEASIPGAEDVGRHYFYSRSGFSDHLLALQQDAPQRYKLVTPADLYT